MSVMWLKAATLLMIEGAILNLLGGLHLLLEMRGGMISDLEWSTFSSVLLDEVPSSAPVLHGVVRLHFLFVVIHYCCPLVRILNYNLLILCL